MKIMILGHGAKELAALKALEETGEHQVHALPSNSASTVFESALCETPIVAEDYEQIPAAARQYEPDLILVMDEEVRRQPVIKELKDMGYPVFAPTDQAAAQLYTRQKWTSLFRRENLPVPASRQFITKDEILEYIQTGNGPWVLNLMGQPKMFHICFSEEEVQDVLDQWFVYTDAADVLVTDYLDGIRFNIFGMVHEDHLIPFGSAIIQRGVYEQEDDGEMKGLGAFSPADAVPQEVRQKAAEEILTPFVKALHEDGSSYTGFLNGEFVYHDGKLICTNVKAGLPDCGSVAAIMRLKSDLAKIASELMKGNVLSAERSRSSAAVIVLTPSEYPSAPVRESSICVDEDFEGILLPHHMTIHPDGSMSSLQGRTAFVAAMGRTRKEACAKALEACRHISSEDLFYRTDIGKLISEQ